MTHTLEWHAEQLQAAFAARRYALARWHCRVFSGIARKRAASFLNDGSGRPAALADTHPACTPSPIHDELKGE